MSTIRNTIAVKLAYYRKLNNMKQRDLADKLNVRSSAISNWENGYNSIDIDTLCNFCDIFNITLNDIVEKYTDDEFIFSIHEKKIIKAFREKPNMQEAVNKILNIYD